MVSKDKIKLINNYVSYCLYELSKKDKSLENNQFILDHSNFETTNIDIAVMILITNFLTIYPFYKGKVASLPWDDDNTYNYFNNDFAINEIFNERGTRDIKDILINDDYYYLRNYSTYRYNDEINNFAKEVDYKTYESGGRTYVEDDLEKINAEEDSWEESYQKMLSSINEDLSEYSDLEIMDLVANTLKDGNKIKPNMLYEFIRNGFAHFHWELIDEELYIFHFNSDTNTKDLELKIDPRTLCEIVHEYVGMLTKDFIRPNSFLTKLALVDEGMLCDEYASQNIVEIVLGELKNSKYYEDFKEKVSEFSKKIHYNDENYYKEIKTKFIEYIIEHGDISSEDKEYLENLLEENNLFRIYDIYDLGIELNNEEYIIEEFNKLYPNFYEYSAFYNSTDSFYDMVRFMKEYFKDKRDVNGFEEKTASIMISSQKMAEELMHLKEDSNYYYNTDESRVNDIRVNKRAQDAVDKFNSPIILIKSLLNALFVQIDYSDLDLSSINFESIKLDPEYVELIEHKYEGKMVNALKDMDDTVEDSTISGYFASYYNAKAKIARGEKKGPDLLKKAEKNLENYPDLVAQKFYTIRKSYQKIAENTYKMDNQTIIEHIRNSLAHGNVDIYYDYYIMSADIIVKDYDKGELTFSGTFKLSDLLSNILRPEIEYQLNPSLPAVVR